MKWFLCLLVRGYQKFLSPVLHFLAGPLAGCRFEPTCSQYFIDAVQTHGSIRGSWMGLYRILRCNPWGGQGWDPVPDCERTAPRSTCAEEHAAEDLQKNEADPGSGA